jgi:hypothetical protein
MNIKNEMQKIARSKTFLIIIYIILGILVFVAIFAAGLQVGLRRAQYDKAWRNQYLENFGPSNQPPSDHGTIGKILSTPLPLVIVEDRSGIEKTIVIGPNTNIRDGNVSLTSLQLTPDEFIVAIGDPDSNGQIQARFIRVLPAPNHL